jgi:hypothetical protein
MNLTTIHTIDIELGLIPNLTLFGLYTDPVVRLIAQNEYASFFVFNSRTDQPYSLDCNDFATYGRYLGYVEINLLFQKQSNSLNKGVCNEI